ncbi:MAG: hypothetical protein V7K46_08630 [Nostoc sp.]
MFCALNGTLGDGTILPTHYLPQKTLFPHGPLGEGDRVVLPRLIPLPQQLLTVIVAEVESICWEISSCAELVVAFLCLEDGLVMIPLFLIDGSTDILHHALRINSEIDA